MRAPFEDGGDIGRRQQEYNKKGMGIPCPRNNRRICD